MAKTDLRIRLLGKALRAFSISGKTDAQIVQDQDEARATGHNRVTDLLLGALVPGVDVRDDTAAGAAGRIPVQVYRPSDAPEVLPLVRRRGRAVARHRPAGHRGPLRELAAAAHRPRGAGASAVAILDRPGQ